MSLRTFFGVASLGPTLFAVLEVAHLIKDGAAYEVTVPLGVTAPLAVVGATLVWALSFKVALWSFPVVKWASTMLLVFAIITFLKPAGTEFWGLSPGWAVLSLSSAALITGGCWLFQALRHGVLYTPDVGLCGSDMPPHRVNTP